MLCPQCHGTHVVLVNELPVPCPECQGMGEVHCCDGLREQPVTGDGQWADAEPKLGPSRSWRPELPGTGG